MFKIFGVFVVFATIFGSCGKNAAPPDGFGKKLKFSKNVPLDLGDFTITFIEKRTVDGDTPPGIQPVSMHYFDFRIRQDTVEKTVTWSSGTGDIAPTPFEINGQKYQLELRMSDKLGRLAEDEIVVWKK